MPIVIVKGSNINKKIKKVKNDDDDNNSDNDNNNDNSNDNINIKIDNDNDNDDEHDHDHDHDDINTVNDINNNDINNKQSKKRIKHVNNNNNNSIKNGVYCTSMDELTDLLTLRVYKVSRPSLFESKQIEAKLIGDGLFIDVEKKDEDEIIIRQENADYDASCNAIKDKEARKITIKNITGIITTPSTSKNSNDSNNDNDNATVIQRIRLLQNKFGKLEFSNKNALKEKIKESEQRKHYTSVGQSLLGIIEENSLNDLINHAIEIANRNEANIAYQVLSLDEELKHYQENKDKKKSKSKSLRNEESDTRKAFSKADMFHHQLDLSQQLDKAAHDQLASFIASISFDLSQRQLSSASIASNFSRKNGRKASIKINTRPTMNHSDSRDPHPPASSISSKARGRMIAPKPDVKRQKSISPRRSTSPQQPIAPETNSDMNHTNKHEVVVSNDAETLLAKIKTESDRVLADQHKPPPDRKPPVFKQKARKITTNSSKTYGNEVVGSLESDHLSAVTAKALEDTKRIQDAFNAKMKGKLEEFHNISENFKEKQHQVTKKVVKANKVSAKVVECWDTFNNTEIEEKQKVIDLSKEIDFARPQATKWKYQCLLDDNGFEVKSNRALLTIIKAEKNAKQKQEEFYYDNLSNATWLLTFIGKLRDFAKRKMNQIPISCFKFLSVFHQLITAGVTITNDIFYNVLEKVITDKGDYPKVITNKTIRAVRDFLKISPESFLKYLQNNNIPPCSELVKHVKAMEKRRLRKQKLQDQHKAKLNAIRELNKSTITDSSRPNSGQGERGLSKNISFSQRSESSRNLLRNSSKMSMASDSEFGETSDWGDDQSEWESRDDGSVFDDF